MRHAIVTLAVLAAGAAVAEPFPRASDTWVLEARAAGRGGEARFARFEGTPNRRAGWSVTVTCGKVSLRNGRETVSYRGTGGGTRGRMGAFGGQVSSPEGLLQGFLVDQQGTEILHQRVLFAATGEDHVCPNGHGDISTGD